MQFVICRKHSKVQKAAHKVTTNCFVCMNRYCQQSFLLLCSQCKTDHRDHSNKILTLEDISFLIQRLLKTPFKELSSYIEEAVSAMKKFKLVQENRRRIEQLEREIQTEVVGLLEWTEQLVHEYANCKNRVSQLADLLVNVQTPATFHSLAEISHQLLSNLQYNYQKDKFQYSNSPIRQKYQSRRKSYQCTRRKLQQVKDYSMKIIEVILANDDDDSEGEGDIIYKKKIYQILKKQIYQLYAQNKIYPSQPKSIYNKEKLRCGVNNTEKQVSLDIEGKNISLLFPQQFILNQDSQLPLKILSIERSSQTCPQWLKSIQQNKKETELKIKRIQQANAKLTNQLQNKITILLRQKQTAKKESALIEQKYKSLVHQITSIQNSLAVNKTKREQLQNQRQSKLQTLIQIANWKAILEGDTIN